MAESVETICREVICDVMCMAPDEIKADALLIEDLCVDSLDATEIEMLLEERLSLSGESLINAVAPKTTFSQLVEAVQKQVRGG